jgi:hypothetical protein
VLSRAASTGFNVAIASGQACDDGDGTTGVDTCQDNGVCAGRAAQACSVADVAVAHDDGNSHGGMIAGVVGGVLLLFIIVVLVVYCTGWQEEDNHNGVVTRTNRTRRSTTEVLVTTANGSTISRVVSNPDHAMIAAAELQRDADFADEQAGYIAVNGVGNTSPEDPDPEVRALGRAGYTDL